MKFWAAVNGGLRPTADAWQNHAYQLRPYVVIRRQNAPEPTSRSLVGTEPEPQGNSGGEVGSGDAA